MKHSCNAFLLIAMVGMSFAAGVAHSGVVSQSIRLDASVGKINASGTSLSDVIDQINVNTGNLILVDWASLKLAHITRELPVTMDISNLPVNNALPKLLDAVGGSHVKLVYSTDNGVFVVTTAAELFKNVAIHVYGIHAALKNDSSRAAVLASIIRRVRGLDPLSWSDVGGYGSISMLGDKLIVTQTPELQARIAAELKEIAPAGN